MVAVIILVLLVMGSVYAIVSGLSTASASMRLQREGANAATLKQAKEGLIAWAATRASDGPGHLPCPDRRKINDAFAGYVETTCVGAPARVGRLPFRTLGLPDLRDGSGERLWYVLSPEFRDNALVPVNSDTQGSLAVEGSSSARGIVAIIFAPGPVLGAQARTVAASDDAAQYLESRNPYVADAFLAAPRCDPGDCSLVFTGGAPVTSPYNDQFVVITHQDLFRVVEPVVQRRMEQEIAPLLEDYFKAWGTVVYGDPARGFYPYAAPYDDPARAQNAYQGALSQTNGLLPMSTDVGTWITWTGVTVDKTFPLGGGTLDSGSTPSCTVVGARLQCVLSYTCAMSDLVCSSGMSVTLTARLRNVAKSLLLPTGIAGGGGWSADLGSPVFSVTPTFDAATGDLLVTATFTAPQYGLTSNALTVLFPLLQQDKFSPLTDVATTQWFARNEWHRLTYYAISDGFRLRPDLASRSLATACVPEPSVPACIRVANGPGQAKAVLVMAGRHRTGGARTYTIANYFEGENALNTPASTGGTPDYIFERNLRTPAFNDRVVVVATQP